VQLYIYSVHAFDPACVNNGWLNLNSKTMTVSLYTEIPSDEAHQTNVG